MQRPGGADLTGRYKVYIIDEVHMLTQEAFNALLKSLEEPPPHVVFVLATTDPQKVPATVASRCQRFDFKPIALETLVDHLTHVAAAEGVRLEPGAAELLARAAAGGARDAISLLDQALAFAGGGGRSAGRTARRPGRGAPSPQALGAPSIPGAQVQAMLGLTSFEAVCRLVDGIVERDLAGGLRLVHEVSAQGVDLRQFARQVLEFLRALLLAESDAGALLRLDEESQAAVRQRARQLTLPRPGAPDQAVHPGRARAQGPVRAAPAAPRAGRGRGRPSAAGRQLPATAAPPACACPARPCQPPAPAARLAPPRRAPAPSPSRPRAAPAAGRRSATPPLPGAAPSGGRPAAARRPKPTPRRPPPAPAGQPRLAGAPAPEPAADAAREAPPASPSPAPVGAPPAPAAAGGLTLEQVQARWPAVVDQAVRQASTSVEALLKGGDPSAVEAPNVVVLRVPPRLPPQEDPRAGEPPRGREGPAPRLRRPDRASSASGGGQRRPFRPPARVRRAGDDPVVAKALRIWRAHILSPDELAAVEASPPSRDLTS